MNKRLFNILGLILCFLLTLLSAEACASKPTIMTVTKTMTTTTSIVTSQLGFLTEDEAIRNALTYFPANVVTEETRVTAVLDSQANVDGEWHVTFGFYNQAIESNMIGWPEVINAYGPGTLIYEAEVIVDAKLGDCLQRSVIISISLGGPIPSGIYSPIPAT